MLSLIIVPRKDFSSLPCDRAILSHPRPAPRQYTAHLVSAGSTAPRARCNVPGHSAGKLVPVQVQDSLDHVWHDR